MAKLRTAYRRNEEGRITRDPDREDADIGPAAAHVNGLAAIGRLSVSRVSEYLQADTAQAAGAGPVERRPATADELARLTIPATPAPAPRPAARVIAAVATAERHSGAERPMTSTSGNLAQPARSPDTTSRKEEPVTVIPATPSTGISIPCTTCLHEPVCALKSSIPASAGEPVAVTAGFADGLRMFVTGYRIECDHYLAAADPEPIRREHGGESWRSAPAEPERIVRHASTKGERAEKAERARRVLDAIERNGGDRTAAAAELGMKANALAMVAKHADRVLAEAAS